MRRVLAGVSSEIATVLLAALALLATGFRSGLEAQAGNMGAFLFAYRAHPGQGAAFEDGYRRHLDWHRQNEDSLVWYAWSVLAGPGMGLFVDGTFGFRFHALDERVDPAGDAADGAEKVTAFADPVYRELYRLRADLSTATPLEGGEPTPFVQVVRYRIPPGGEAGAEAALEALRVRGEGGALAPFTCYELLAGGEAAGFLLMIWRDSWAAFGDARRDPDRVLRRSVAPGDGGPPADGGGAALALAGSEIWRYRPDLTYLPGTGSRREP